MRINDTRYGLYSHQNQLNRSTQINSAKKSPASADISISSRGREISQAMMSEQTQRQQRIQDIKQQIAAGTYQVDSSKVAEKLVDFWKGTSK